LGGKATQGILKFAEKKGVESGKRSGKRGGGGGVTGKETRPRVFVN